MKNDFIQSSLLRELAVRLIVASSLAERIRVSKKTVYGFFTSGSLEKKPSKAILQAWGQKKVLDLVEKWAKVGVPITLAHLLKIHKIFFGAFEPEAAGRYRRAGVKIRGSKLIPTPYFAIAADMNDFNKWLIERQKSIYREDLKQVAEFVAHAYHTIVKIHPFEDGNGRSARLFVNLLLRKYRLPYIIIPKVDNALDMREALEKANGGDYSLLVRMFKGFLQSSIKFCLKNYKKQNL